MSEKPVNHEAFPLVARIAGVAVVTIPATEYADLLRCRAQLNAIGGKAKKRTVIQLTRLERDPEVARFIESRIGHALLTEIRAECIARFGKERTPSSSALHRFATKFQDVRLAAKVPHRTS